MNQSRGPLPSILAPLSYLAARAYRIGYAFDSARSARRCARLDVPVISIGNMTVGGTGKTPICAHLAGALQEAGARPAIALRGYRSNRTGGSDEAAEYRERLPGVPILVGADRTTNARDALAQDPGAFNVLLLDDGFQHRQLHRDLDIVLIDATRPGLDGDLLPHGWLREPAQALSRADIVIVTHSSGQDHAVEELVRSCRGVPPEVFCRHTWERIDLFERGEQKDPLPPGATPLPKLAVATGLGNPTPLLEQVRATGAIVTEHLAFRDHVHYDRARTTQLLDAARRAGGLLVTSKDWVKLRRLPELAKLEVPVLVPRIQVELTRGAEVLADRLRDRCGYAPSL